MKRLISMTAAVFAAATAHAAPYCGDLVNKDALPKNYAKSAPFYSDAASGWIFTQDQLKDRYDMKASSQAMVTAIVEEFAKRDVQLAIVVPPPRPIVAGQATLDAAMGAERYDVAAAKASFDKLIEGLAATGAIVPNLADVALMSKDTRDAFYFQRDTHWTTTGSVMSAIRLSEMVNAQTPEAFQADATFGFADLVAADAIEEKGSLAKVVRDVCALGVENETAQAYDLARASAGGLLGDTAAGPSIALVGSSFSNRYQRDHYRFGEALAWSFDADVENYSVSGGGPIGAIEAYVLSGALDRREHELVVWEIPYTESFNSSSFLRQLLGALRLPQEAGHAAPLSKSDQSTSVDLATTSQLTGIEIVSQDTGKQDYRLEVVFADGSTSKVALRRRNAVPSEMRSQGVFGNLEFFGTRAPVEIKIRPVNGAKIGGVTVFSAL